MGYAREGAPRSLMTASATLSLVILLSCTGREPPQGDTPGAARVGDVADIPIGEYAARRRLVLEQLPDGLLLLHARSTEKTMEQWGFIQDPAFLYLTGLPGLPGAILALDGPAQAAYLFLPPPPQSFGMTVRGLTPEPGPETAARYALDSALPWNQFEGWVRSRLRDGVSTIFVDDSRRPEATGSPPGFPPLAGDRTLWRTALGRSFPSARIESAKVTLMRMRAVKSDAEVRVLARNARTTVAGLLAVAGRLEPGVRQRETEGAMIAACLDAGGEGPSFWPWTMSGPNALVGNLVGAFFRYDQGDRAAQDGELARVDVGCAGGLYGADVGRTLPVSGRFAEGQAEAWDLLVAGYRAGLAAMRDGVPVSRVRAASIEEVIRRRTTLTTATGRAAAEAILSGGDGVWHIHGVGIESGEDIPDVLAAGMVVAYEPGITVGNDAFYLEDMILVTTDGHEVLSAGLPYTADEIAEVMASRRSGG
jgi:Xaa-Pro aminopeptidase